MTIRIYATFNTSHFYEDVDRVRQERGISRRQLYEQTKVKAVLNYEGAQALAEWAGLNFEEYLENG